MASAALFPTTGNFRLLIDAELLSSRRSPVRHHGHSRDRRDERRHPTQRRRDRLADRDCGRHRPAMKNHRVGGEHDLFRARRGCGRARRHDVGRGASGYRSGERRADSLRRQRIEPAVVPGNSGVTDCMLATTFVGYQTVLDSIREKNLNILTVDDGATLKRPRIIGDYLTIYLDSKTVSGMSFFSEDTVFVNDGSLLMTSTATIPGVSVTLPVGHPRARVYPRTDRNAAGLGRRRPQRSPSLLRRGRSSRRRRLSGRVS